MIKYPVIQLLMGVQFKLILEIFVKLYWLINSYYYKWNQIIQGCNDGNNLWVWVWWNSSLGREGTIIKKFVISIGIIIIFMRSKTLNKMMEYIGQNYLTFSSNSIFSISLKIGSSKKIKHFIQVFVCICTIYSWHPGLIIYYVLQKNSAYCSTQWLELDSMVIG